MSAMRGRLNATPASSTVRADSVAGRSRASTIKGPGGPLNISAVGGKGGTAATPGGEQEFTEYVGGVEEYESRLKQLWQKRTALMKVKKKKKPKRKQKSALRRNQTSMVETETNWDDDKTSFMTTAELAQNQDFFVGLIDDTIKLQPNQRKFKTKLFVCETLGIEDYDAVTSMDKL